MSIQKIGTFIGNTALALVTISAVAIASHYVREAFTEPAHVPTVEEALAQSPEMFALFDEKFPVEYSIMRVQMAAASLNGETHYDVTNRTIVEWRKRHGGSIAYARDGMLRDLLAAYVDVLKLVESKGSSELCGRVLTEGTGALTTAITEIEGLQDLLEAQLMATIGAVASGRDEPVTHTAPSDADWDTLFAVVVAEGATTEELNALVAMKVEDPAFCSSSIQMLEAMLSDDTDALRRVRADYAKALLSS